MAFVQSALVFNVVPTVIEVAMVSGLLVRQFKKFKIYLSYWVVIIL